MPQVCASPALTWVKLRAPGFTGVVVEVEEDEVVVVVGFGSV